MSQRAGSRRGYRALGSFVLYQFLEDEDGNTAIEYGLIVSLVVIAITGTLYTLGRSLNHKFQRLGCEID